MRRQDMVPNMRVETRHNREVETYEQTRRQPRKASDVFTTEQEAQEAINRRNKDEV